MVISHETYLAWITLVHNLASMDENDVEVLDAELALLKASHTIYAAVLKAAKKEAR